MAKTRAEINRQNYLRNKQKRLAKANAKYKAEHEQQYILVKNIPMHKQIGEFLIDYMKTHKYFDSAKYNKFVEDKGARTAKELIEMLQHKNKFVFELSDMQMNNILLAACYRYSRVKNQIKSEVIANESTRDHANELSNKWLKLLDGITSNTKQSEVRRNDGFAFFDVEYIPRIVGGNLAKMKSFTLKDSNPVKDQQIYLNLKMTKKTFEAWKLYTKGEMKNLINDLLLNEQYYEMRDKCLLKDVTKFDDKYVGVENNFENFHLDRTVNEVLNKERMIALRVSEAIKSELDGIMNSERIVDFQKVAELSRAIKCLLGTNITFSHGRLYFMPFTHLKKYYRKYLTLNGKNIDEVFDIPNCHSVMSLVFFAKSEYRNERELAELKKILIYGSSIYNWIMDQLGIEDIGEVRDEIVKPNYNHWMFMPRYGKKKATGLLKQIDKLIKKHFPNYYQFLYNQKEIEVEEFGKKVKKCELPVKSEWLQNELVMNGLFNLVKDKDAVVLHDAIWMTKDQCSDELKVILKEQFNNLIEQKIKGE